MKIIWIYWVEKWCNRGRFRRALLSKVFYYIFTIPCVGELIGWWSTRCQHLYIVLFETNTGNEQLKQRNLNWWNLLC